MMEDCGGFRLEVCVKKTQRIFQHHGNSSKIGIPKTCSWFFCWQGSSRWDRTGIRMPRHPIASRKRAAFGHEPCDAEVSRFKTIQVQHWGLEDSVD
jgi:hypothetical protein